MKTRDGSDGGIAGQTIMKVQDKRTKDSPQASLNRDYWPEVRLWEVIHATE